MTREDLHQAKLLVLVRYLHDAERDADGELTPAARKEYEALAKKLDDREFLVSALRKGKR